MVLETHQHAQRAFLTQDWLAPHRLPRLRQRLRQRLPRLRQVVANGPVIAVEPAQLGGAARAHLLARDAAAAGAPRKLRAIGEYRALPTLESIRLLAPRMAVNDFALGDVLCR